MDWTSYLFGFRGRVNRAKYWLATLIKRLHDRDKSGWWMVPFFFIPGLYKQFAERLPDSYLVLPLAVIVSVFCLWGFIEMYCLKGTRWTNRFGPNPLGKDQSRQRERADKTACDHGMGSRKRDRNGAAQSWPAAGLAC